MNRRNMLRWITASAATGVLMPAQAERLLFELRRPVSVVKPPLSFIAAPGEEFPVAFRETYVFASQKIIEWTVVGETLEPGVICVPPHLRGAR